MCHGNLLTRARPIQLTYDGEERRPYLRRRVPRTSKEGFVLASALMCVLQEGGRGAEGCLGQSLVTVCLVLAAMHSGGQSSPW